MKSRPKTKMADRGAAEKEQQHCWKFMTTGEKVLLILLILSATILVTLFLLIVIIFVNGNNICYSKQCVKTSAKILQITQDDSSDPCNNFHSLPCNSPNPQSNSKNRDLLITSPIHNSEDSESIMVVKQFYQKCINSSDESNDQNLVNLVMYERNLGGWPIVMGQKWDEESFHDWWHFMTLLRNKGIKNDFLVSLGCGQLNDTSFDDNILKIGPPVFGFNLNGLHDLTYHEKMVRVAIGFGSSVEIAWEECRKIVNFEKELAKIVQKSSNSSSGTPTTVAKLNSIWPTIDLPSILHSLSRGYSLFDKNTTILVNEGYVEELNSLLIKTPKRSQVNYMIWKVIESYLPFTSDNLRLYNEESREEKCLEETTKRFHATVERTFLSTQLTPEITEDIKSLANSVLKAVKKTYFDEKFEEATVEITDMDDEHSGVSDILNFQSDNIIEMIAELNFRKENTFFSCLMNENQYQSCDCGAPKKDDKTISYDAQENKFYIPSILLQNERFYDSNQPQFENFAKIGPLLSNAIVSATLQNSSEFAEVYYMSPRAEEMAYKGYNYWATEKGAEKRLVGLENYTPRQLFWIIYYHSDLNNELCDRTENGHYHSEYFLTDFDCQNKIQ